MQELPGAVRCNTAQLGRCAGIACAGMPGGQRKSEPGSDVGLRRIKKELPGGTNTTAITTADTRLFCLIVRQCCLRLDGSSQTHTGDTLARASVCQRLLALADTGVQCLNIWKTRISKRLQPLFL